MYEFVIDAIRRLPVVASQDQEFWLAAAISCPDAIGCLSGATETPEACHLSPVRLLDIYHRCLRGYERLAVLSQPSTEPPGLRQIIAEAIGARERIFHFRVSKLFRCLTGAGRPEDENAQLAGQIFEIAQCLSVLPCNYLRRWISSLDDSGASLSESEACAAFNPLDCDAVLEAIYSAALEARKTLVEGYLRYSLRLARNQINSGLEFEDMVQEAALAGVYS